MKTGRITAALAAVLMLAGCADSGTPWTETDSKDDRSSVVSETDSKSSEPDDSSKAKTTTTTATTKKQTAPPDSTPPDDSSDTDPDSFPDDSKSKVDDTGLYDTTPISQAYLTGDDSGLDDMQKAILGTAKEILNKCVKDGMTPQEKELAVHDYICRYGGYDYDSLDAMHSMQPHSDDPYGMLVLHRGICAGYATSFKLFMDMLGIENQIVHATANRGEEHAWNMVKFDGDWYFVDVTWDDEDASTPDKIVSHYYFNCTEDRLKEHSHEWDQSKIPHATGTKYSFVNMNLTEVSDKDQIVKAVKAGVDNGYEMIYIVGKGKYEGVIDPNKSSDFTNDAYSVLYELDIEGTLYALDDHIIEVTFQIAHDK